MFCSTGCNKDTLKRAEKRERFLFGLGIFFIVLSFAVYFVYPLIPFLPLSTKSKVIVSIAVWGVGWGILSVGFMLSGKEGYKKIKDFVKKLWR
ncbi:MAG: transporter suffix domain-containing protein [Thermodesulfobacteriota bacterium]